MGCLGGIRGIVHEAGINDDQFICQTGTVDSTGIDITGIGGGGKIFKAGGSEVAKAGNCAGGGCNNRSTHACRAHNGLLGHYRTVEEEAVSYGLDFGCSATADCPNHAVAIEVTADIDSHLDGVKEAIGDAALASPAKSSRLEIRQRLPKV